MYLTRPGSPVPGPEPLWSSCTVTESTGVKLTVSYKSVAPPYRTAFKISSSTSGLISRIFTSEDSDSYGSI